MIDFLVDANLPPKLAILLVELGHRAGHLQDHGLLDADDGAIWNYAAKNNVVIVTKDKDFAQRRSLSDTGPSIVWIRLPNTRRADLLRWFTAIFPNIIVALENGERMIEVV